MSKRTSPSRTYSLTLADGRHVFVAPVTASRVRGIDADGDILLSADDINSPDSGEHLIPLTPCCHATGRRAADSLTRTACQRCGQDVDSKFSTHSELAIGLAATVTTASAGRSPGEVLLFTATATDGPTSLVLEGVRGRANELIDRLKAATANAGPPVVHRAVTVRVTPPSRLLPTTSAAIATAAIAAAAGISTRRLATTAVIGDVGLDGSLRPTQGLREAAEVARAHGIGRIVLPATCLEKIGVVDGIEVLGARRLAEIAQWLGGDDNAFRNPGSARSTVPTGLKPETHLGPATGPMS